MNKDTNTMPHVHGQAPADLLKFIAYKKIANNFEEAVELVLSKKLVLGEPIAVPFYYTHKNQIDPTTGQKRVTVELVFGIGSADIDHPYISCSINNSIANESLIVLDDGNQVTLKEYLDSLITKDDLETAIHDAIVDGGIIETITDEVINSDGFNQKVTERLREVTDVLRWKSFDELSM